MATRSARKRPVKKCPECRGSGETRETVRVGSRKGHATDDQQAALCQACLGTGLAADSDVTGAP
jgi:DnaJ-class molecular chaperone